MAFRMFVVLLALFLAGCQMGGAIPAFVDFEAALGTSNFTDAPPFGLFVFYQFHLQDYASSGINVVIRGPSGWNGGNPLTLPNDWTVGRRGTWWTWWAFVQGTGPCDPVTTFVCQAVTGEYTVEATVNGRLNTVRRTIDASAFIPRSASVTVTSASLTEVNASWAAVSAAESYQALLRRPDFSIVASSSLPKTATSVRFTGLNLDPAGVYHVAVRAFTHDLARSNPIRLDGQMNRSQRVSATFSPSATGVAIMRGVAPEGTGDREFGSR